jgi:O-antigen/teichoic acid export membrane protein
MTAPDVGEPAPPVAAGDGDGDGDEILASSMAGPTAVRGGAIRVGGFALGSLVGVVASAFLYRHLGRANTGNYGLVLALVALVGGVSDLGLSQLGIREMAVVPRAERATLARDLLGMRIVLSLTGLAGMLLFAGLTYSRTIALGVAIAGGGLVLQTTQDNYSTMLQTDLRFAWVAAIDVLRQLATAVLIIVLVLLGAHLLAFVSVTVWAGIVCLAVAGALVRRHRSLLPRFDLQSARRLIRLVLPYSAATVAAAVYGREALVLISLLSSGSQLSYYTVSSRVIDVLASVPALLVGTALPIFARAARHDHARFEYAITRVFEVALIVGAGTAVALGVGAPLVIQIFGYSDFAPATGVLAIQGIGFGAGYVATLWGTALVSQGRYRSLVVLNIWGVVAVGAVVGALAPVDGARGAAIATSAVEVGMALISALLVCRQRDRPVRIGFAVMPKVALAAALAVAPVFWTAAPDVVRLLLAGVIYAVVILLTRALPREVNALVPARWRPR